MPTKIDIVHAFRVQLFTQKENLVWCFNIQVLSIISLRDLNIRFRLFCHLKFHASRKQTRKITSTYLWLNNHKYLLFDKNLGQPLKAKKNLHNTLLAGPPGSFCEHISHLQMGFLRDRYEQHEKSGVLDLASI